MENAEHLKVAIAWQTALEVVFSLVLVVGALFLWRRKRGVQPVLQIVGAMVLAAATVVSHGMLHHQLSPGAAPSLEQLAVRAQLASLATFTAVVIFAAGYIPRLVRIVRARQVATILLLLQLLPILTLLGLRILHIWMAHTATVQTVTQLTLWLSTHHVTPLLNLTFATAYLIMAVRLPPDDGQYSVVT